MLQNCNRFMHIIDANVIVNIHFMYTFALETVNEIGGKPSNNNNIKSFIHKFQVMEPRHIIAFFSRAPTQVVYET